MSYRLGVDVGGTFTDLFLVDEKMGRVFTAKVPSTPADQSIGVLNGITRVCEKAGIAPHVIDHVMHGTTVATNTVLTGTGARCGLVTTKGYRQVLQIARSYVPGGLGGWVIYNKSLPLAPLSCTVEALERVSAQGEIVTALDETQMRRDLRALKDKHIEALTVSLINSFANAAHEQRVKALANEELPGIPVSLSSEVVPEMQEYERTVTTVANSYVRPNVAKYIENLRMKIARTAAEVKLHILRSDGGLAGTEAAVEFPVNLLMSGPAGGVTGALWVALQAGFPNLLTVDVGGTSTDVALIQNGAPRLRRETTIGDVTVRASSIDIRTVGAGGGSIAHVPELTKALRVGPQSAGADPGPAAYGKGGIEPTVTDANVVLGYLPAQQRLGGDMSLNRKLSVDAVQRVAKALDLSLESAALGIYNIVNENMVGALRLVSVEQGYDPRDYALIAFGGAGPLHANALARLLGSWPVIIPPGPGVLCALGDATTTVRDERSRTYVRKFSDTSAKELQGILAELAAAATLSLQQEGVSRAEITTSYQVDLRYHGQGLRLTIPISVTELKKNGLIAISDQFDAEHKRLFTFALPLEHELVTLRAAVHGRGIKVTRAAIRKGSADPQAAFVGKQPSNMDGRRVSASIYQRDKLQAGNKIPGPAIVLEMDSTTVVLPRHYGLVDAFGNILIYPDGYKIVKQRAAKNRDENQSRRYRMPAKILQQNARRLKKVKVDTVTIDIIESALRNARFEMDTVLFRTAMSPGIREQHDEFPMIANVEGKMVVGQFGSFIWGFMQGYDGSIEDGDIFLTNDPYSVRGAISHANDWLMLMPIYRFGRLIAWAAMFGHMTDVGGKVPGSLPTDARTIYEEGVTTPPVKIYKKNVLNEDVLAILLHNCRLPHWNLSDFNAIIAALRTARTRCIELSERFGDDVLYSAMDAMLERNKRAMRQLIVRTVPEQKQFFEDYLCDDGLNMGPYKIACTMWREGEKCIFDFAGTDPQSISSINFLLNEEMFKMFAGVYMIMVFDPQILFNDGFYDLMEVRIPAGSLLKPLKPAALSCRTHALGRIFDVLGGLLGQGNPQFMCAAGFSDSPHFMYSGYDKHGDWYQLYQITFGGIPGKPFGDGPDGHSLWPSFTNVPNEFLESYFPLRIEVYETIPDTGGPGRHRGGNGLRIGYRFLEPGEISIHDDRWLTYPWGVNGGLPGARSRKQLLRVDGREELLHSKIDHVKVEAGDLLLSDTWGGGGCGDPLERDPQAVQFDVEAGLVTAAGAERYGVVLDAKGEVDSRATSELRTRIAKQRGAPQLFDRGFASIEELKARCLVETGLAPPSPPKFPKWASKLIP